MEGDSITIKSWKFSSGRYLYLKAQYTSGTYRFNSGSFSAANLFGSIYAEIRYTLIKNKFNLISTYLQPRLPSANNFFGTSQSIKIAYEDNGSVYIPQYNINTIGNIDITEGYHTFVTDTLVLNIQGLAINVNNYPLYIEKNRFNSIAYLYEKPMNVEYAFNSIKARIKIVQDDKGGVWIPSLNLNTIGNLQPLSGYQIFSDSSLSFNFTYPALPVILAKESPAFIAEKTSHFNYQETGIGYNVVLKSVHYDGYSVKNGDEIAVFDGEICVGAGKWKEDGINYITCWKGNEEAKLPGYTEGNKIQFKIYSSKDNLEFTAEGIFGEENQRYFGNEPFSVASLKGKSGLIPVEFSLQQNYPNPFNPSTTIRYDVAKPTRVDLTIYNILGEKVITLIDGELSNPGKYSVEWNGKDTFGKQVSTGIYLIKFYSAEFTDIKKAILLK